MRWGESLFESDLAQGDPLQAFAEADAQQRQLRLAGPGRRLRLGAAPGRELRLGSGQGRQLRLGAGPARQLRLVVARHRRPISLALALIALWVTIRSAAPPAPPTVEVILASHDLPAGATLVDGDLRVVSWPASLSPGQAVPSGQAIGHVLATAISTGEPVTRSRLLGPGLLAGQPPGSVAVTVRVADPAALLPIHAGDRIDVFAATVNDGSYGSSLEGVTGSADSAAGALSGGAVRLAAGALVLSRPEVATGDDGTGSVDGSGAGPGTGSSWTDGALGTSSGAGFSGSSGAPGVVVLAVDEATAARLAAAAPARPLSVILLPAVAAAPDLSATLSPVESSNVSGAS